MTESSFQGFPGEGLRYLTELGEQDKKWFAANRKTYDQHVVAPTKAFVEALGATLQSTISPTIVAEPKTNGSIAPINNDLRFSPDKPPYKDHLLLRFWDGPNKKTAPMLMVRISENEIGFSSGAAITNVDHWRERIDTPKSGEALVDALKKLKAIPGLDIADDQLKKVPKPYPAEHPRADLLRHRGVFHIRWPQPAPTTINTPTFVDYCAEQLQQCAPLHHWFIANLAR